MKIINDSVLNALRSDGYDNVADDIISNIEQLEKDFMIIGNVVDDVRYAVFVPPISNEVIIPIHDLKNDISNVYKSRNRSCYCWG